MWLHHFIHYRWPGNASRKFPTLLVCMQTLSVCFSTRIWVHRTCCIEWKTTLLGRVKVTWWLSKVQLTRWGRLPLSTEPLAMLSSSRRCSCWFTMTPAQTTTHRSAGELPGPGNALRCTSCGHAANSVARPPRKAMRGRGTLQPARTLRWSCLL